MILHCRGSLSKAFVNLTEHRIPWITNVKLHDPPPRMVNEPAGDSHKIIHNFPQPLALRPARTCMLIRQIFGITHCTSAGLSQGDIRSRFNDKVHAHPPGEWYSCLKSLYDQGLGVSIYFSVRIQV